MEQNLGTDPNVIDKSRVLEVKPLRCLVPVFPGSSGMSSVSTPQPTPFVCVPPMGPFPLGVQPFYPFVAPNSNANQTTHSAQPQPVNLGFENSIPAPVPLNSYRTPTPAKKRSGRPKKAASKVASGDDGFNESPSQVGEFDDGEGANVTRSGKRRGRSSLGKEGNEGDIEGDALVNNYLALFKLKELDDFRRSNGDKDTAAAVLLVFNLIRRRLTQIEETKDSTGAVKRPDLKASNLMMKNGARTNQSKRIGNVPGIEIGDIFFFRMELCLVGLHAPSMAGIDYMGVKVTADEEPLAVSIVSSGGYDDDRDDSNVIIYSGQGGVQRKDGQVFDQKLERGNLALEKSVKRGNEIRVLRGVKDPAVSTCKIYIYDGLYKIQESWVEKSKTGCNVFKYKIIRIPGQQEAFSIWKTIQQWRDGTMTRPGIILPDLTSGGETQPVVLVNDVDGERGPAHFTYIRSLRYTQPFSTSTPSTPCHCTGGCQPGDTACPCVRRNDGFLPYSSLGVLLSDKPVVYECGPFCGCPPTCRNRMTQAGVKLRLEVFKTKNRGWGLRSWDPIRSGIFICEYAGDAIKGSDLRYDSDEFIFDSTRKYPSLGPLNDDSNGYEKTPFPLIVNSKHNGNVARFMNHSCSPNVYWLPVLRESNNDVYLHIAFFALRHIPPMQELTFDYGMVARERGDRGRKCFCGTAKCRGYFYG